MYINLSFHVYKFIKLYVFIKLYEVFMKLYVFIKLYVYNLTLDILVPQEQKLEKSVEEPQWRLGLNLRYGYVN